MRKYAGKIMRWTLFSLVVVCVYLVSVTPWQVTQAALVLGTDCGFVTVAPSADPADGIAMFDTRAWAIKDTSDVTATIITEIGVWIDNATEEADITLGIYTHNVGDDNPEARVGAIAVIAKGTGGTLWKKATGLSIAISSSTIYWIAAQLDDTATQTNINFSNTGGNRTDYKTTQTTLTDPWGVSNSSVASRLVAIYAVWEAAPAGNIPIFMYHYMNH